MRGCLEHYPGATPIGAARPLDEAMWLALSGQEARRSSGGGRQQVAEGGGQQRRVVRSEQLGQHQGDPRRRTAARQLQLAHAHKDLASVVGVITQQVRSHAVKGYQPAVV